MTAATLPDADERLRYEAEHWLDEGYTTRDKVDALIARIAQKRGQAAADKLRAAMRDEWARRRG